MKLTNSQIVSIAEAHLNLDGLPEKPFKFIPRFRYSLSKNLRLLNQRVRDLETERVKIIREIAPGDLRIEKDTPQAIEFERRYDSLMEDIHEIPNLMSLRLSDLNLGENDIPVRVLSALGPIITEDVDLA